MKLNIVLFTFHVKIKMWDQQMPQTENTNIRNIILHLAGAWQRNIIDKNTNMWSSQADDHNKIISLGKRNSLVWYIAFFFYKKSSFSSVWNLPGPDTDFNFIGKQLQS